MERSNRDRQVTCHLVTLPIGPITVSEVAARLNDVAVRFWGGIMLLDGPQGWKDPRNGLEHSRRCERELNTPAKTGVPGCVKPANYHAFVAFSIAVFDALECFGWKRLSSIDSPVSERTLVESFPLSAWRSLGLRALPAKSKTRDGVIEDRILALEQTMSVSVPRTPTHDELQAVVAGLAGLSLYENRWFECSVAGVPPVLIDSTWREGFIVNPQRLLRSAG